MSQIHNPMQDNTSADANLESGALIPNIETKEKHKRLFQRGCQWIGVGALILGLSFGITFLLFQSDKSFLVYMYIMTSIGGVCVFKGLVDILG